MNSRYISRWRFFKANLSALNVVEKPCQTVDFFIGRKVERWMVCSEINIILFLIKLIYFVAVKISNDLFTRRFIARLKGNRNEYILLFTIAWYV